MTNITVKKKKYYSILLGIFISALLTSNILSSAKIIDFGITILDIPLIFDGGIFLFPLCYIIGDILTEVYGYKTARQTIWIGFFCSLILVSFVYLIQILPGENLWENSVGQTAYNDILGGIASGGIIIASLTAYLFGEFSNSYVLAKMKVFFQGRYLWKRTITSTLIGEFIDSFIFVSIAVLFGIFPKELLVSIIFTNYIFKVFIELLFTPILYIITHFLKKYEKIDFYDVKTQFNPFTIRE